MTPALRRMLTLMQEAEDREDWEDAEAVADGLQVWVGDQQFHWKTVEQGIRLVCLRDVSDVKGAKRFTINATGRLLLRCPDQEDAVQRMLLEGGAWTIRDDKVVRMEKPTFGETFG